MKYCKKCKADNPDDAKYCHMCGKKFQGNLLWLLWVSNSIALFGIVMLLVGYFWIGILATAFCFLGVFIFEKEAD